MQWRNQKGEKLEISFAQKNKWSKDWMQYWFYMRTMGSTSNSPDGKKNTIGVRDDPDEAIDSRNSGSGHF